MSFIIGFSFSLLLAIFTVLLYIIAKRLPKEFLLTSVVLLFAGDATLVALWYYGLSEVVDNIKLFKFGIAVSFMFTSFGRAIYFMLSHDNEKV